MTDGGGFALKIKVTERGMVPRKMRKVYTAASKTAWKDTGLLFHSKMRDRRFSRQHGKEAGYQKRKGEQFAFGSKEFWSSYTGTKWKKYKHTNPLQYSGETRDRVRTASMGNPTSKGIRVVYPGARKLNFRPKGGTIKMADEFRRIVPSEKGQLASHYDKNLERGMKADTSTETWSI